MDLKKRKEKFIEKKKQDIPMVVMERNFNMLYAEPCDLYEEIGNDIKSINRIKDIEELYNVENEKSAVIIDMREKEYTPEMDDITLSKQLNSNLIVIAEDIILENYQVFLHRVFGMDGVIFNTSYVDKQTIKDILLSSLLLGTTPILKFDNEDEMKKIEDWSMVKVVLINNKQLITNMPKNVKIISEEICESGQKIDACILKD